MCSGKREEEGRDGRKRLIDGTEEDKEEDEEEEKEKEEEKEDEEKKDEEDEEEDEDEEEEEEEEEDRKIKEEGEVEKRRAKNMSRSSFSALGVSSYQSDNKHAWKKSIEPRMKAEPEVAGKANG
ncbi:hypothetical protein M8J76_015745 [Diaphorina citri]|nr:hypothetical protein M8J76_015745 [Diaphorina citri]